MQTIRDMMVRFRYEFRTVSIAQLAEVQESVGKLVNKGLLDRWLQEKWHFYLKMNDSLPQAETIFIVAMPQPLTRIEFFLHGSTFYADIPPTYFNREDNSRAEEILTNVLQADGYKVAKAHLALKTLAVRSGMASYGKNNISYITGMGSLFQLVSFYTDWPCEEDSWHEPKVMKACENCSLCRDICPIASIPHDRILIHAEKCLGSLAEKDPDSAPWIRLQPDWRNELIGCMYCQFICPINKPYLQRIVKGPSFTEKETELILHRTSWERLSPETRHKLSGTLDGFYSFLVTSLGSLITKQNSPLV